MQNASGNVVFVSGKVEDDDTFWPNHIWHFKWLFFLKQKQCIVFALSPVLPSQEFACQFHARAKFLRSCQHFELSAF